MKPTETMSLRSVRMADGEKFAGVLLLAMRNDVSVRAIRETERTKVSKPQIAYV